MVQLLKFHLVCPDAEILLPHTRTAVLLGDLEKNVAKAEMAKKYPDGFER